MWNPRFKFKHTSHYFFVALFSFASILYGEPTESSPDAPSAYRLWNQMLEQTFTRSTEPLSVSGTKGSVTFGAEKEASSGLITRIMGPTPQTLKNLVSSLNADPGGSRQIFLREFLTQFASGKSKIKTVHNVDGNVVPFDMTGLKGVDYSSLSLTELEAKLDLWLERAGERYFSHLKPAVRMDLFKGNFPGLDATHKLDAKHSTKPLPGNSYSTWKPLWGAAQKFIDNAHNTGNGWEVNFLPQASYGEFEEMVDWFQESLKNAGKRFEAPGHQRLVYPKRTDLTPEQQSKLQDGMGEVNKNLQAYVVLRGLLGESGIEISNFKDIFEDTVFTKTNHNSGRGVLRLEDNRFKQKDPATGADIPTYSIELRSGTKTDHTRRLVEQAIAARYAANDYEDLAKGTSWTLIPANVPTAHDISKRFGVSPLEAQRALNIFSGTQKTSLGDRIIRQRYLAPFWQWENAPYLSATKKAQLKELTRSFIRTAASWKASNIQDKEGLLSDWVKTSDLPNAIEHYLTPKAPEGSEPREAQEFHPARSDLPDAIDVNQIDLGIEYTGRFPIKLTGAYNPELIPYRSLWMRTQYDLTPKEREQLVKQIATNLGNHIKGDLPVSVKPLEDGSHGHSLNLGFELRDAQGRKWRIEWDGVGRDYDTTGKIIPESIRGGHVEVVTPKFVPTKADIEAVFASFQQNSFIPSHKGGGGHINIDLAPFQNNPKAMARFISHFLEHRGIISLLFQDVRRVRTGEPNEVSPKLIQQLRNFSGTEEELKQLLYNERFFNTRLGRKTQYVQMNLNAYFQDVIPEQFLNKDFDLKNDPWRENFSLDPKIRKGELRLFNAPESEHEAQMQIKLVRALLHKALNETTPLTGKVQPVQHETYSQNPQLAFNDFAQTMQDLQLDPNSYRGYLLQGMDTTRRTIGSENFLPLEDALLPYPKQETWGNATPARSALTAIESETRDWDPSKASKPALLRQEDRIRERELVEMARQAAPEQKELKRTHETLPLELTLSEEQVDSLPTADQLRVIFERMKQRPTDAERKKLEDRMSQLRVKPDFATTLSSSLQISTAAGSLAYPLWLIQWINVKETPDTISSLVHALASPSKEVRQRAISVLEESEPQVAVKLFTTHSYELFGTSMQGREDALSAILIKLNTLTEKEFKESASDLGDNIAKLFSVEAPVELIRKGVPLSRRFSAETIGSKISHKLSQATSETPETTIRALLEILSARPSLHGENALELLKSSDVPILARLAPHYQEKMITMAKAMPLTQVRKLPPLEAIYICYLQQGQETELKKEKKSRNRLVHSLLNGKNSAPTITQLATFATTPSTAGFRLWLSQYLSPANTTTAIRLAAATDPNPEIRLKGFRLLKHSPASEIPVAIRATNFTTTAVTPDAIVGLVDHLSSLPQKEREEILNGFKNIEYQIFHTILSNLLVHHYLTQNLNPESKLKGLDLLSQIHSPGNHETLEQLLKDPSGVGYPYALRALAKRSDSLSLLLGRKVARDNPSAKILMQESLRKTAQRKPEFDEKSYHNSSLKERLRTLYLLHRSGHSNENLDLKLAEAAGRYDAFQRLDECAQDYSTGPDAPFRIWLIEKVLSKALAGRYSNNFTDANAHLPIDRDPKVRAAYHKVLSTTEDIVLERVLSGSASKLAERSKEEMAKGVEGLKELITLWRARPSTTEKFKDPSWQLSSLFESIAAIAAQNNDPQLRRMSYEMLKEVPWAYKKSSVKILAESNNHNLAQYGLTLLAQTPITELFGDSPSETFSLLAKLSEAADKSVSLDHLKLKNRFLEAGKLFTKERVESINLQNLLWYGFELDLQKLSPEVQTAFTQRLSDIDVSGGPFSEILLQTDLTPKFRAWLLKLARNSTRGDANTLTMLLLGQPDQALRQEGINRSRALPLDEKILIYQTTLSLADSHNPVAFSNELAKAITELPTAEDRRKVMDYAGDLYFFKRLQESKGATTPGPWLKLMAETTTKHEVNYYAELVPEAKLLAAAVLAARARKNDALAQSHIDTLQLKSHSVYSRFFKSYNCEAPLEQIGTAN